MAPVAPRRIPRHVRQLPLGQRIRWARQSAGLSHDRLVEKLGRSNRGHLIKIERGLHAPRPDLRDAIADACGVQRELFQSDDEEDGRGMTLDELLRRQIARHVDEVIRERLGASSK